MAPITSFVKISPNSVVPIRIFINRKELINQQISNENPLFEAAISSATTTSHRALVRLRSSTSVHLSNSQISQLITVMKNRLIGILFKDSMELLHLQAEKISKSNNQHLQKNKDELRFIIEEAGWRVRIYLSLKFIQGIRSGILDTDDLANLIIKTPRTLETTNIVLEEDPVIAIPDEGEDDVIPIDEKPVQKYDYKKATVIGKGIKTELLQIPKRF